MPTKPLLRQVFDIAGGSLENAGEISMFVKQTLMRAGLPTSVIRKAAIACYEAEMNVVMHSDRGTLRFSYYPSHLEFVFSDEGKGIASVEQAMQAGYSTADEHYWEVGFGAGMGLPNIKKNTDWMKLSSPVGVGTELRFIIKLTQEWEADQNAS